MNLSKLIKKFGCAASLTVLILIWAATLVKAEDGYRLWLRYDALPAPNVEVYRRQIKYLNVGGDSATARAMRDEMQAGLSGLLGANISVADAIESGAVVIGTPKNSALIAGLKLLPANLGGDGFIIRTTAANGKKIIVIAANSETGAFYGAFHFLRLLQTLQPIAELNIVEKPKIQLRMLDHWDNLDGSIERGYAGKSLWNWVELPDKVDARLTDYARANASIGINGAA